jgi:hypothetical protein
MRFRFRSMAVAASLALGGLGSVVGSGVVGTGVAGAGVPSHFPGAGSFAYGRSGPGGSLRACLTSHGVTFPVTAAERAAVIAAARGCGFREGLTTGQRSCLQSHGVTFPLNPAEKDTVKAAAAACGISWPGWRHPSLTPEQRTCLTSHGVTFPITRAERSTLMTAVEACGISFPHPASP